jgi:hypothetical protein
MLTMPKPWTGTKWEYERYVINEDSGEMIGALAEHQVKVANSYGGDGWELVSVLPGREPIPSAPGETSPVLVLLFKRPVVETPKYEKPEVHD